MAASRQFPPDVLQDILTTLHRLEMRFDDQNDRLGTVESSIPVTGGSPMTHVGNMPSFRRSPTADGPMPYFPRPLYSTEKYDASLRNSSASEYVESVMRMRNRFEFDSRSELAEVPQELMTEHDDAPEEIQEGTSYMDGGNDWYTMSVYSSRPLSRLELDIPPVPGISQQETCTCEIHQRASDMPRQTMSYHDTPTTATSMDSPSFGRSLLESEHSASTAPSTAPSTPTFKQSQENIGSVPGIYGNLKQSFKRSMSIRSRDRAPAVPKQSLPITEETASLSEAEASVPGPSLLTMAKRNAKACISILPRSVSFVTRRLVEQQLKMLELKS